MAIEESRRETGGQEEVSTGRPPCLHALWGRGQAAVFSRTCADRMALRQCPEH